MQRVKAPVTTAAENILKIYTPQPHYYTEDWIQEPDNVS